MQLLVILQNPYNKGCLANGWNPARWRKEFTSSRTGRRLQLAVPQGASVRYTNANPLLGDNPDACWEPSEIHVRRTLARIKPDAVLACGLLAEKICVQVWTGPVLAIPHPACRVLTNLLLSKAKSVLGNWMAKPEERGRVALRQLRGRVEQIRIPKSGETPPKSVARIKRTLVGKSHRGKVSQEELQ